MADDFGRQLADLLYGSEPTPESPQDQRRISQLFDRERLRRLAGAGEAAATIGTGLLSSIPAGYAGLSALMPTRAGSQGDLREAAKRIQDVQGALTFVPRTEYGTEYLEGFAKAVEPLSIPAKYIGDITQRVTGSPTAAGVAETLADPINLVGTGIPSQMMKTGIRAAKAAPRVAGEVVGNILTPTPRTQAQRGAIDLGPQIPEFQPQSSAGLVSRTDEALASLPRQRGTGAEFLRELQKTPGVKPAELEERGLIDALSGMGKVTKADVLKVLQDNPPVKFEEVVLGGRDPWRVELDILENRGVSNLNPQERARYYELMDRRIEAGLPVEEATAKFQDYSIPGGENYREILLTLPSKRPSIKTMGRREYDEAVRRADEQGIQDYTTPHWEQPNVLAHARISDRTGPSGEKILHVEEVQSDWHQTGRKSGYKTAEDEDKLRQIRQQYKIDKALQKDFYKTADEYPEGSPRRLEYVKLGNKITPRLMKMDSEISRLNQVISEGVPDAPFKKNWHELMMRRLVDYAAKNGYDRIAITPGAEQASRYDLSKQINSISWTKRSDGLYGIEADAVNGRPIIKKGLTEQELERTVGKDIANRIVSGVGQFENDPLFDSGKLTRGRLENLDLQVGGEGMKGFYDKILPTYLNELGKPYGVKVGQTDLITQPSKIEQAGKSFYQTPQKTAIVHSFDITPQMREAIKSKGLPLYAKGGSVRISDNPDTMRLELAGGGAVAAAKAAAKAAKAAKEVPPPLPRAPAKTKAEIEAIAERIAPQLVGEYVRKSPESAITAAGKTKKQFEREKDLPVELTGEARTPTPVDIESLKGKTLIGIMGDPSITGRELKSVGDIQLESAAPQHGGPLYGMGQDEDIFWASGKGAAKKVQNLAEEVSKQYGADVLGKYIMMGPEGLNYAQHFADANLQAIDLSKMTKRQVEQFNNLIRKGSPNSGPRPTFPGIEDKESAYLHFAMDPKLRIHFNSLMQMPTVTEAFNLPSGQDIRYAITEPLLRDLERGVAGMSIGEMRPGRELTRSMHPTYEMDIPGKFIGSSKYPTPYELMFPDTVKAIRENPAQAPQEFGSLGMVGPRQVIDQQMIDEIKAYEERIKRLTGKKKGGAVKKQAGGAIKAALAAAREKAALMAKARKELEMEQASKEYFERPAGYGSQEKVNERAALIKAKESGVLPAAERDANLAKMLQESKAKTRLYHGTKAHDEYADEPGQAFKQFTGSPTWLAEEPYTASGYSGGTGSTYPVYAQIKKPLVLRFDANDEAAKAFAAAKRLGVDVEYIKGMSAPEKAWEVINHPSFIDAVERAGYDGISVKEGGYRTFGVLDPRRIKSATGNRGTFDVTNPDITKKRGGKVSITNNLDTMRLAVQKRK